MTIYVRKLVSSTGNHCFNWLEASPDDIAEHGQPGFDSHRALTETADIADVVQMDYDLPGDGKHWSEQISGLLPGRDHRIGQEVPIPPGAVLLEPAEDVKPPERWVVALSGPGHSRLPLIAALVNDGGTIDPDDHFNHGFDEGPSVDWVTVMCADINRVGGIAASLGWQSRSHHPAPEA